MNLTDDTPTEDGLQVFVVTVPHGDAGSVRHGPPDVGSVNQVSEVLHSQGGNPLAHDKAQSVHDIGLA